MQVKTKELLEKLVAIGPFATGRTVISEYMYLHLQGDKMSAQNQKGACTIDLGVNIGDACVNYTTFAKAIRLVDNGATELEIDKSSLIIRDGDIESSIPLFNAVLSQVAPSPGGVTVAVEDLKACCRKVASLDDDATGNAAEGIRIAAKDGVISFVTFNGSGAAGSWCDCSPGEFDVNIPLTSVAAMVNAVDGGDASLSVHGGQFVCSTNNVRMGLPIKSGGARMGLQRIQEIVASGTKCDVPIPEVVDFLKRASQFIEEMATGIDIKPTGDGIDLAFDPKLNDEGNSFEPIGRCKGRVAGKASGPAHKIKCLPLLKIASRCGSGGKLVIMQKGIGVTDSNYVAMHAGMAMR